MPDQTISPPGITPFDLDGLADLARKASPDLAREIDQEAVTAPIAEPSAQSEPEVTPPEPQPEPEVKEPEPQPEPEAKEPEPEIEEPAEEPEKPAAERTLADELAELNRQSSEAKTKAPVKPAEAPKETQPPQRDDDLKLDVRQSAAMHPKTKKIIEERNQKIIAERNKAEALAKEKEEMAAELNRIREELKKGAVPKDVEEELGKLRERIRELDIVKDPSLEIKYDRPVAQNQEKILKVLQEFGVGKTQDGKDDPEAVEALKQQGLNFKTVAPYIKKLSEEGYEEEAEELRELLRDNIRIKNAKEQEISEWKVNFDAKKQQAAQFSQQQQEKTTSEVREHASRILNSDISELSKEFPFLNRPAEPVATDSPAVAKAKQDAIAAYDAAAKSISAAVAQLDPSKVTPDKFSEVSGRITANAVQNVIIKQHILPRLMKDLAELRSRNSELEAKVGKIKTAGSLSRAHAAAATAPAGAKAALPESTEDAAKQIAKEMGLSVD
jgi:hypothetical protein